MRQEGGWVKEERKARNEVGRRTNEVEESEEGRKGGCRNEGGKEGALLK